MAAAQYQGPRRASEPGASILRLYPQGLLRGRRLRMAGAHRMPANGTLSRPAQAKAHSVEFTAAAARPSLRE
eukprot:1920631-Pyramimonas_sp.AAC.1